jgi:HKD family nuclease
VANVPDQGARQRARRLLQAPRHRRHIGASGTRAARSELTAASGHSVNTVLDTLRDCLNNARFDRADLIVSFVMRSGITLIGADVEDALDRGVHVRLLTTDYLLTTEPDALARLLDIAEGSDGRLEVRVFSDDSTSFHPKAYLFWSSTSGSCRSLVGSSNLSRSGIALGIEWSLLTQQNAGRLVC